MAKGQRGLYLVFSVHTFPKAWPQDTDRECVTPGSVFIIKDPDSLQIK